MSAKLCEFTAESATCGEPATESGPLGNHYRDERTGPLCTRHALIQRMVIDASTRLGVDPNRGRFDLTMGEP